MQKPSIPKGTRDFTPSQMVRRNYIFQTIQEVFKLFGYEPIETPAMENLSTLLGKYGEEGDKLLFRILNSGDFWSKVNNENMNSGALSNQLSERGLRYDLTVPFARFVVQHRNEIDFPFKRYQMQPVWRADRPQKGRYREFYQCDADVVGSNSLLNEVELLQMINEVFQRLGINVMVKLNNRKILAGIANIAGADDKMVDITVAIDKLDKIGKDKVLEELAARGLSQEAIDKLLPVLEFESDTSNKLEFLKNYLRGSEIGLKGIEEIETIFTKSDALIGSLSLELDLTLARGLNYYTGAIIEVKSSDVQIGSICGGGRYDDLTGIFGLKDVSGVGISFGMERIYDVMQQLDTFPKDVLRTTEVLFVNFGETEEAYCLLWLKKLRDKGIAAEVFPDAARIKKQMNYANSKAIPFVVLAGSDEIAREQFTLKNMVTGEQELINACDLETRIMEATN